MKDGCGPLRYACFQPEIRNQILELCDNTIVKDHLNNLYDLIFYQMRQMDNLKSQIIAAKHKDAWKHYNIPDVPNFTQCTKKREGC